MVAERPQMRDVVAWAFPWARGGGDSKAKLLRLALRLLPLRRRVKLGDYVYVNASKSGVSASLAPYKGLTILLQPGKTPLVTMTIPGSGMTHRYRLPGPRLAKLSLQPLLDGVDVKGYRTLAELTMDRLFPGVEPPDITFVPGRVAQIARFDEDGGVILVSRPMLKKMGAAATESAVRRETVRAGVFERHGELRGDLFESELARAGELTPRKRRQA